MKYTYRLENDTYTIEIDKTGAGYRAVLDGQEHQFRVVRSSAGEMTLSLGDQVYTFHWAADGPRRWISIGGKIFVLTSASVTGQRQAHVHARAGESTIMAPMPGLVRAIQIAENDTVVHGQTLLVLEAMKMEIRVPAPRSGRIAKVLVRPGQSVEREQVLVEIE